MMSLLHPPPRQGKCRHSTSCVVGLRHRTYHILSGSVLGVWTHIEGVFARHSTHNPRMQIVRVRTPEKRLCGKSICMHVLAKLPPPLPSLPMLLAYSIYLFWLVNSASHAPLLLIAGRILFGGDFIRKALSFSMYLPAIFPCVYHCSVLLPCAGIQIPGSFVEDMTQTLARIDQQAEGTGTSDDPIQL